MANITLSYHTCGRIKKPHEPEVNCKVKTLKEVKEFSKQHPDTKMYVNWDLLSSQIIENGKITYDRSKEI